MAIELASRAVARLAKTLKRANSRTVSYSTGASSIDWSAVKSAADFDVIDDAGLPVRVTSITWQGTLADLQGTVPTTGHKITEVDGGITTVYEVAPPPGQTRCYRVDPYRKLVTIYANEIAD
jgi:hypothetical protein